MILPNINVKTVNISSRKRNENYMLV